MSVAGSDTVETIPLTVPPALEATGVSKTFGSVRALEDVSLTLESGEEIRIFIADANLSRGLFTIVVPATH